MAAYPFFVTVFNKPFLQNELTFSNNSHHNVPDTFFCGNRTACPVNTSFTLETAEAIISLLHSLFKTR